MTVYKAFFKIVKSKFASIFIYFIIFAVLTIFFSAVGSKNQIVSYEQTEVPISIIDRDKSNLSDALTQYLDATQKLVTLEDDKEVWTDELFYRNVEYVLVIPENFEKDILIGKFDLLTNYKLPDSTSGSYIDMQIEQYLNTLNAFLKAGHPLNKAITDTSNSFSVSGEVVLTSDSNRLNEVKPSHYYFFQYLPYIFLCILINGLCPVLTTFRNKKLSNRIDCSSLSLTSKNVRLIISSILFSLFIWILFMILGIFQYSKIALTFNYILLVLNSITFMLVALSISFLVAHFIKNENVLNLISNVVALGSSFLCGIFVPQYLLDEKVLRVGQFLPPYWYIKAMDYIFTKNYSELTTCLLIQLGFAIAFTSLALVVSKQAQKASG